VVRAMKKDSGLRLKELKVDGGAAKNDFLCQFQADILGVKVIRPKITEITSLGAAYLAGLAIKYYKNSDEIRDNWQKDKVFKPRLKKEAALELYKGWLKAVKSILSI
ncbi:MAG: glycerol kinase, partial [Candidatus Omnitrophica bacterium]|nr:glycerol kinase [Candidatus Omnitrophota bacterium]